MPLPKRRKRSLLAGTGQLDRYMHARSKGKANSDGGFSEWCAVKIQSVARMRLRIRVYTMQQYSIYQIASLQIQGTWRDHCQQRYMKLPRKGGARETPQATAAQSIQDQWRRYTNLRIFRYYRDLINFRLVGDPYSLLRTVCPLEAGMFDRALGIHVRFRLGGSTFPPMMYFKCFLHKPLCDVGAFAPRDYTESRPYPPASKHNHDARPGDHPAVTKKSMALSAIRVGGSYFGARMDDAGPNGTKNWYRRVENNPWRPITNAVLGQIEDPPPGMGGDGDGNGLTGRGKPFHYLYTMRAEERVAKRKRKKRRWLASMYAEGLAKEREDAKSRSSSYDGAEDDVNSLPRARAPIDWGEDDVDSLLTWTKELDYDAYTSNWASLATSGPAHNR